MTAGRTKMSNRADVTAVPKGFETSRSYWPSSASCTLDKESTGVVRPGKNTLAIKITNLWANRLAGDARLPQDKRITRITQKVRLGGPLESGLFGPVQLRVTSSGGAPSAPATGKPGGVDADR